MSIVKWDEVVRDVRGRFGAAHSIGYADIQGELGGDDSALSEASTRLALHVAIGTGRPASLYDSKGGRWGVAGVEDRWRPLGGILVRGWDDAVAWETISSELAACGEAIHRSYGWVPELMQSNRQHVGRTRQLVRSIEEQREQGLQALYDFEQERVLLAAIRAGDRESSRILLNELLTPIFMESASRVVLQARAVELVTRLTRTALEDNPMLTMLWTRWRGWTESIVAAESVEVIARAVLQTLEGFVEGVFVHGARASSAHVHRALTYISENYASPISLREVSREVGISASRLAHLFREDVGRSVLAVVHEVRIRHARDLLERSKMNCAEIAYEVGYSDQSYFTRVFRQHVGQPPLRYRRDANAQRV